jgi:two-component system chemotaxis response regulator CheY
MAGPKLEALAALVVDDHEPTRALLSRVLRNAGLADVRDAADAATALALLADRPAHLILADNRMPGMDGLDFIRAVRAEPRLAHARILMLTGDDDRRLVETARAAGADAVLAKPAPPSELLRAIAALF